MERCVACGKNARKVTWAVYGDEAFKNKNQVPFPLHERCFTRSETLIVTEWVAKKNPPRDAVTVEDQCDLVETEIVRYRRVNAPADDEATDG